MKNLLLPPLLLSLIVPLVSYSQIALDSGLHGLRAGDRLIKQEVSYGDPGLPGENLTWDFSNLSVIEEDYLLIYFYPSEEDTSTLTGWEHQTRYRYVPDGNLLFMAGYENRRVAMEFREPELYLSFPFQYGDTLSRAFSGSGKFFQEHELVASGRTYLSADASGKLVTPANDTLFNVLRVKRSRVYEDVGVPDALMRLDTYLWYAPGYRYPVFESIRSVVITSGEEKEDFSKSFFFPLAGIESLADDPENEAIREEQKEDTGILLSCEVNPNPVEDFSFLRFELSEAARVTIRLCDVVGNPVALIGSEERLEEGSHEKRLSMSGLRRGNYILHIRANEYVKHLVIIKK